MRLPRDVEADPRHPTIRQVLAARTRKLWTGGTLDVAVVPLTDALARVLRNPAFGGMLQRGLESAVATLSAEHKGLAALPADVAGRQGQRVSRVCLVTEDGAERFYRQVDRLAVAHAPRVLVCMLACDSAALGAALSGTAGVVKLVLTGHKTAATAVLRALADG